MWKPASSTPLKRPRRSTTNAFCWGTTTAVLDSMKKTMKARTKKTNKASGMLSPFLFRADPEGQALDPFHPAALSLGQGDGGVAARVPGGSPELGLAHPPRGDLLEDHRHLPDQAVHGLAPVELEMPHEGLL